MKRVILSAIVCMCFLSQKAIAQYKLSDHFVGHGIANVENDKTSIFDEVKGNQSAEFPGGMFAMHEYLSENLQYPQKAIRNNIQGTVVLKFKVDEYGNVSDVTVVNSVHPECDKEALRVVSSMPRWSPCYVDGNAVEHWFTLSVKFKLINDDEW